MAGANEGNPPTTHTPPLLNLSSALTLQPCFVFYSAAPFLLLQILSFTIIFCTGVGTLPFYVALSVFSPDVDPPLLPHIPQQQLNNELMFDYPGFCFSHTHSNPVLPALALLGQCLLSPHTLNDFSVLPWCVHHFCLILGSNQRKLCFLRLIILCVPLYCH